jgi:4'-phosphopantetheinyl transferase
MARACVTTYRMPDMAVLDTFLYDGDVHVWHHVAASHDADRSNGYMLLSADERVRASSMTSPDSHTFVCARAQLRRLISGYTGLRADRIVFDYDDFGKPEVRTIGRHSALQFSTSHSGGDIVHAFSLHRLGVDIETPRESIPWPTARLAFTGNELSSLLTQPEPRQARRFLDIWTQKEAYVKAHGGRRMFRDFEVSSPGAARSRIAFDSVDPFASLGWTIYRLEGFDTGSTALAIEGATHRIRCFSADTVSLAA